jgi:hypothetical protein
MENAIAVQCRSQSTLGSPNSVICLWPINTGARAADSSETVMANQAIMFGPGTPSRISLGTLTGGI